MVGTVINLLPSKKFGFISATTGEEYFFHMEDVLGNGWDEICRKHSESEHIQVEFQNARTPKGLRARNVSLIED